MGGVLDGVRVVEVSMWAMVPAAGAILAEWGADVIKVEGPSGDPIRALVSAGIKPDGPKFTWEMWNRGKREIVLDLTLPEGRDILHQLVAQADVFLTSILPHQRAKLGLDLAAIRAANPQVIYAVGTGLGARGPEAEKGGYDGITFWGRGGPSASLSSGDGEPVGMPAGAFGDSLSGMALAGGVSAALAKKARTGEGSVVEGALFATALWAMQMSITGARAAGLDEMPSPSRRNPYNPLVNNYPTSDGRWIALCMLQSDLYWAAFCHAIGRDDLVEEARFVDSEARAENTEACVDELEKTFLAEPLEVWVERLGTQEGQWDVIKKVSELPDDPQVQANRFAQRIDYGDGHELTLITSPIQFDQTPPTLRRAPDFSGDTDAILQDLGMDDDAIIAAKIAGAVI